MANLLWPVILLFYGDRRRFDNADRYGRAGRQRGRVASPGHHGCGPRAGAGGRTDGCALRAAEDAAENRSTDGAAANLRRALARGAVAFAIDRVGLERHARPVRKHDRCEPDAEPRAVLYLAAALNHRHLAPRLRAGRNGHAVSHADRSEERRV